VLDIPAEVVASSDDYELSMGGGVSAAIRAAAGTALALDAAKTVPREAGDVVVTTAGALRSRYVFHAVTIGPFEQQDDGAIPQLVRRATRSCLELGRVELTRALERHRHGEAVVIPVILKPADWQNAGLAGLQALPKDAKPVSTWPDRDEAYLDIAQG
jgi:hypothetical protein